jgi:curved DNA-binding protein CbpA
MKRITAYRKLMGVGPDATLKELKSVYRNLMKECHPDNFHDNEEMRLSEEARSKDIIEAYHFLVSISPETLAEVEADYQVTLASCGIIDFNYDKQILTVHFMDGSIYEYYGVPRNIYIKMVNSDAYARFVRRHIAGSYVYRSTQKRTPTINL